MDHPKDHSLFGLSRALEVLFQWKNHSAGFLSSILMILMNIITYHYVKICRVTTFSTVDIKLLYMASGA